MAVISAITLLGISSPSRAQYLYTEAGVEAGDFVNGISIFDGKFGDFHQGNGSVDISRIQNATYTFTGKDLANRTHTMTFIGSAIAAANYLHLGASASGVATDIYYGPNPPYITGTEINPDGSPALLRAFGQASSQDVITFKGHDGPDYHGQMKYTLQGHSDPRNGIVWAQAQIDVGDNYIKFVRTDQDKVEFVADFVVPWDQPTSLISFLTAYFWQDNSTSNNYGPGDTVAGSADYIDTLTLDEIVVLGPDGKPITDWTVSSASGTVYPTGGPAAAVPEPGFPQLFGIAALATGGYFCRRRAAA